MDETEPAEKKKQKKVNSIGSVEISITTRAEEADEATKLGYSASDREKCEVEKVAVVAKMKLPKISRL